MEVLKPYASKVVLGVRSKVEVYKLSNKKDNTVGSKQKINKGFVTSFDQVVFSLKINREFSLTYS